MIGVDLQKNFRNSNIGTTPIGSISYEIYLKRKRGRPRKNWMDDIAKAMRDRGLEEEWTLDRKKWKRTVVDSSDGGI